MIHPMLAQKLKKLSRTKNIAGIQKLSSSIHPARVAEALAKFSPQHIAEILSVIKPRMRAAVFSYLTQPMQMNFVEFLKRNTLIEMVAYMPADRRADFFNQLPGASQELLLGIFLFSRVVLFARNTGTPGDQSIAVVGATIATAMGLQVITARLIGALLPLAVAKLKLDPAVVASPALTTIVDITGLLIFFVTIRLFLGI